MVQNREQYKEMYECLLPPTLDKDKDKKEKRNKLYFLQL